jgi:WD40 repeat protein
VSTYREHQSTRVICIAELKNTNLVSGHDGSIVIWDSQFNCLHRLTVDGPVGHLLVLGQGGIISAEESGKVITIFDDKYKVVNSLYPLKGEINDVVELSNGDLVVACRDVVIYRKYELIKTLNGHTRIPLSLLDIGYGYLASAGLDGTIRIWDI